MILNHTNVLISLRELSKEAHGTFVAAAKAFRVNHRIFNLCTDKRGCRFVGWDSMLRCLDKLGYEVTFSIRKKE